MTLQRRLTDKELDALVEAFRRPPYARYRDWTFDYEYGFFVYYHRVNKKSVYFTPDWHEDGVVSIQVNVNDDVERHADVPLESTRPEDLFAVVEPYLTMYGRGSRKYWNPRE